MLLIGRPPILETLKCEKNFASYNQTLVLFRQFRDIFFLSRSSLVTQQVKVLALSLQWLELLLWHGFDPLARDLLHALGMAKKEK